MQIAQLVPPTQLSNIAVSANDANAHRLSRKERREQAGVRHQWEHKKMMAAVSTTIAPAEAPQKKGLVKLHSGQEFVLIFECTRKDVPSDVQVLPLSGGNKAGQQENTTPHDTRLGTVKVDLCGLMERVSVQSINVKSKCGYIIAFVNCVVGKSKSVGFNDWGKGVYEAFVKHAMSQTWNRAIIKEESNDRTTLTLRKAVEKQYETKIRFAIE